MRDSDIRTALRERLSKVHALEPDTLILDELGLCEGATRVDMAVVNGEICGYEIKSDRDTLLRLPSQAAIYERTLDRISIVVGWKYKDIVEATLPSYWGITTARQGPDGVLLQDVRPAELTPGREKFAVAQLLWREEAWAILVATGHSKGLSAKPRADLWNRLAEVFSIAELGVHVRTCLKARDGWRKVPRKRPSVIPRGSRPELSLVRQAVK